MTDGGGSSDLCICPGIDTGVHESWCPWTAAMARVAREDRNAEVRLRGEERVAELEREANRGDR